MTIRQRLPGASWVPWGVLGALRLPGASPRFAAFFYVDSENSIESLPGHRIVRKTTVLYILGYFFYPESIKPNFSEKMQFFWIFSRHDARNAFEAPGRSPPGGYPPGGYPPGGVASRGGTPPGLPPRGGTPWGPQKHFLHRDAKKSRKIAFSRKIRFY